MKNEESFKLRIKNLLNEERVTFILHFAER